MALLSRLTDFGTDTQPAAPIPVEQLPGYAQGHAAGLAAAQTADAARTDAALETLSALVVTQQEARRDVARSLGPLLDAVCRHILPRTAPQALAADVAAAVDRAVRAIEDAPMTLRAAPELSETVQSLLPPSLAHRITLIPDQTLSPLCVVFGSGGQETIFDRDALIAQVCDLFDAFFDHLTESPCHG